MKRYFMIFLLILSFLILFSIDSAFAQYGVIIVTDSSDSSVNAKTEQLIEHLKILRDSNKINKKNLVIWMSDWSKEDERNFCINTFELKRKDLPYTIPLILDGSYIQTKLGERI